MNKKYRIVEQTSCNVCGYFVFREKVENVKQGSGGKHSGSSSFYQDSVEVSELCLNHYNYFLEEGMCAEQARMVLPQNVMTEWIWSGSLGAFLDMLILRLDPHTQLESRIVAQQIAEHVKALFPVSYKARIND